MPQDKQFESEKKEVTKLLGYCPSPDTISVTLHPEDEGREKAARMAEDSAEEEAHEHERLIKLLKRDIKNVEAATRFPERIRTERIIELKRQITMHERGVQP